MQIISSLRKRRGVLTLLCMLIFLAFVIVYCGSSTLTESARNTYISIAIHYVEEKAGISVGKLIKQKKLKVEVTMDSSGVATVVISANTSIDERLDVNLLKMGLPLTVEIKDGIVVSFM